MNENTNSLQEITLFDIIKILRKKAKAILCIALIALILGSAAGAAIAMISNENYGTNLEFYITSTESNDYILSLLRSDNFAELLLLDENGMPSDKKGTEGYAKVVALKAQADAIEKEKEEKENALEKFPAKLTLLQREYQEAQTKYDILFDRFTLYTTVKDVSGFGETIKALEQEMELAATERNTKKAAYDAKLLEQQTIQDEIDDLSLELRTIRGNIKSETDNVLVDYRKNEANLKEIESVKDAVTYKYANSNAQNNNSQASVIVTIAASFNQELAQKLLDEISVKLVPYVEDSIIPTNEDEKAPQCTLISVGGKVGPVDYKHPVIEAGKFGIIAFAGALVFSMMLFIFVEIFIKTPLKKDTDAVESNTEIPPELEEKAEDSEEPDSDEIIKDGE